MEFRGVRINVPMLIVFVLFVLAVCSILAGAAWKYIHPFAGGVVAGWESFFLG